MTSSIDTVLPEAGSDLQTALHMVHEQIGEIGFTKGVQVDVLDQVTVACKGKTKDELLTELGTWYLNTKAKSEGKKAELKPLIDEMQNELRYYEKRLDFIKWAITNLLEPSDESDFVNDKVALFYQRSEKTVVTEPDAVPIEYCKVVSTPQLTVIKEALESGENVPGCEVETRYNLQVKLGGDRAIQNAKARQKKRMI
ncbi:MAG: hypothetical protein HKN40_07000 [Winogradskyella sp.]|uniref:siphovirus Gp157 family protein n=1 Tax=Winogradskyella sp. TaxID=1883156 RepID=UPI0017F8A93A|nr:hypothetical protein [Winogradskyella sp.]